MLFCVIRARCSLHMYLYNLYLINQINDTVTYCTCLVPFVKLCFNFFFFLEFNTKYVIYRHIVLKRTCAYVKTNDNYWDSTVVWVIRLLFVMKINMLKFIQFWMQSFKTSYSVRIQDFGESKVNFNIFNHLIENTWRICT